MNATINLKIGGREIFRIPLVKLKGIGPMNQNMAYQSNIQKPPQIDYRRYDIVPKFLADQNVQDLNKEIINRFTSKKTVLEKLLSEFLNKYDSNFTSDIIDLENEMNNQNNAMEYAKSCDYKSFQNLIKLINESGKNITPDFQKFSSYTQENFKKLDFSSKNEILKAIANNKRHVAENTGVNMTTVIPANQSMKLPKKNVNNYNNQDSNPYNFANQKGFFNNNFNVNKPQPQILKQNNNVKYQISQEKMDLFRKAIGNQDIPNEHVVTYFDILNPSVLFACEKYFRNFYQTENLTLYFVYPEHKGAVKQHVFHFTDDYEKLIMAAQDDFISIDKPRIVPENGKALELFRKHGYIGTLGLKNKGKINIYRS